jgi:ubiquitin carboxyl-terminal hydrolase 16/45
LVFDLSPYVSNVYKVISGLTSDKCERNTESIIYSLYAIVEHSGSLRSGHYKAYVRCNDKDSENLKKFLRLKPYVPKVTDLMELITLDDIEKSEDNEVLNEMLTNMNLKDESSTQMNGNINENLNEDFNFDSSNSTNADAKNKIKEELIRATKGNWFHLNDSNVTQVQLKNVLKAQAYLLFYERRY